MVTAICAASAELTLVLLSLGSCLIVCPSSGPTCAALSATGTHTNTLTLSLSVSQQSFQGQGDGWL